MPAVLLVPLSRKLWNAAVKALRSIMRPTELPPVDHDVVRPFDRRWTASAQIASVSAIDAMNA
jgi:hypothetical protein